ncbi:hypothetical protein FOMPIDRAFT_1091329, partial [Fomitopsis schrenkii]
MPGTNHLSAPSLKSTPLGVRRYFKELEDLFKYASVADDAQKIKYARRYVGAEEVEVWMVVNVGTPASYQTFVENVKKLYPGAEGESHYSIRDLESAAAESKAAGTKTRGEEAEFYRWFLLMAMFLRKAQKASKHQVCEQYLAGFPDSIANRIRQRAEIQNPTLNLADGFDLEKLHNTAKTCLDAVGYGGGGGTSVSASSGTKVKIVGDITDFASTLVLAMLVAQQTQTAGAYQRAPYGGQQSGGYGYYQNSNCNFCNAPGHMVCACPEVAKYLSLGRISMMPDNRVAMPDGRYIPRSLPGRCMKDRVDYWH